MAHLGPLPLPPWTLGASLAGAAMLAFMPATSHGQQPPFAPPEMGAAAAMRQAPPLGPNLAPADGNAPVLSGPRQLVVEVQVTGNEVAKDYEIQKHIHTRRDREFDAELVQADVRRLVTTGLFRDVKTFTQMAPGGVIVTFEVFERPRIHEIVYWGNRGVGDKKLNKEVGLKRGDPLNAYSCEEARRKVEEIYRTSGYPKATVTVMEGDKPGDKRLVLLINEGQLERIGSVAFEGNTISSDARLKTQIESKPGFLWYFFGGKVDRTKIDADVETLTAYYRSLGYFRARIGRELVFDDSGKWLTLKFIIDEGPRYVVRNVSVEGNQKFASQPLLDFLQLKSGKYFNQSEMNRDLNTIIDLYGSQGHVFADVQADPRFLEEPGQIDLVYRIQEGEVFKVGDINVNIAGEFPHTRQTVVLNRMGIRPGDIMDSRKIRDAERRLKASQLFEINPAEGDPPRIAVRPPDPMDIRGMAGQPPPPGTIRGQSPEGSDIADRYFPQPRPADGPYTPIRPAAGSAPSRPPSNYYR